MTKSEIENLITYLQSNLPKGVADIEVGDNTYKSQICCSVATLYDVLREYPSDEEKTCGPNYENMYHRCLDSLEEMRAENRKLRESNQYMHERLVDREHLIEKYTAALNTIEVMTGNRFTFLQQGGT